MRGVGAKRQTSATGFGAAEFEITVQPAGARTVNAKDALRSGWSNAANTRGASPGLRLIERFTRTGRDAIDYQVTFVDPGTWTAPWTAALDMKARRDDAGVFEYACHEGNYGMFNMLAASRLSDK